MLSIQGHNTVVRHRLAADLVSLVLVDSTYRSAGSHKKVTGVAGSFELTALTFLRHPPISDSTMSSRIPVQENPDAYARSFGGATLLSTPASESGHLDQPSITLSQLPGSRRTSPHSTTSSTKAVHICDQCSRAFSRAEHLERHQTTHLPSTATKSFVCPSCSKGFTRKDVLTRHVRAVHETKKSEVRKSRRKSCRRCAAFKIKCTGGGKGKKSGERAAEPCEACRKRDVECIFDFGVTVDKNGSQDQGNPDELFDFVSDDMGSEPETHSSEHSVKRRKTIHHTASSSISTTASMYLTSGNSIASAVSPTCYLRPGLRHLRRSMPRIKIYC
ncbi:hypothetical protein BDD12DRAFT_801294 [Trichophaea hybrida]|nr:hypothetical protein BDD12DRAFT_801294 [Trichophaea hybrida]